MKKAFFISVAAHALLLLAFIFFRLPADTPAGDVGVVVVEVEDNLGSLGRESLSPWVHRPTDPQTLRPIDQVSNPQPGNSELSNSQLANPLTRNSELSNSEPTTHNPEPRTQNSELSNSQLANPQPGTLSGNPILTKIRSKINRAQYYPVSAQRQKLSGKSTVIFQINQDGSLAYVNVVKSSGSAILDEAAMETVRRSTPLPYYSEPIILPIKFSSKNQ